MAYKIEFSADAREHVRYLKKRDQAIIIDAIADQLTYEPNRPTTHRKSLEDNQVAPWELRVGDFRVFYDVNIDEQVVEVVAVGHKVHNRLLIGGEEIEL
jgi:mRNA-degrading endonuclease RelE of RelBE toxin-antitoxin system